MLMKQIFYAFIFLGFTSIVYTVSGNGNSLAPPTPTLVFGTTIRVAEAYASSPGAVGGDGCLAAEERLQSGNIPVSKVVFDGEKGRLRQSNIRLEVKPAQNITSIGRWDISAPREWDLTTSDGSVTCNTELLPKVMCPNGTLPPSCNPSFGTWGALNPFTSVLGMWYPNTTKADELSTSSIYRFIDVKPTLIPNEACGTAACTMRDCSKCVGEDGKVCTKCPCLKCVEKLNITRNYTYTVATKPQADGTHQLIRYQWTQGIPLRRNGSSPGIGRDCFIFDWSQDWTSKVHDNDFAPPPGLKCT